MQTKTPSANPHDQYFNANTGGAGCGQAVAVQMPDSGKMIQRDPKDYHIFLEADFGSIYKPSCCLAFISKAMRAHKN